jgi:serine/threonine protein kinase
MPPGAGQLSGRQLGDYVLEAVLGVGGMAEVYRGWDLPLEREVAVKVLPAALARDSAYVARFRNEARRVGALQHPHIVPVYSYGELPILYLVMPILAESLRQRLRREGRLEPSEAVRIGLQIASALAAAHQQGIVHRDVKSENILLDAEGEALLSDFGIARELGPAAQGATQTISGSGLPAGTPEYMAPEQLRNERIDFRADIYGLGVVLYELLVGVVPHRADTPYGVAALALTAPIIPPSDLNPRVWPALERVVLRSLARRPEDRYPSAQALGDALSAALAQETTHSSRAPGAHFGDTQRFAHAASRPLVMHDNPTEPSTQPFGRWAGVSRVTHTGGSRQVRTSSPLLAAAAVLLAVALCGSGTLVALRGSRLLGYLRPTPTDTPTATLSPTDTPTPTDVPTATTVSAPPLAFDPNPIQLIQVSNGQCKGYQYIANGGSQTLGWQWQSSSPDLSSSLTWSLNDPAADEPWPPQDPPTNGVAAEQSDTLWLALPCSGQSYTVTAADSLGNSYTFMLQSQ